MLGKTLIKKTFLESYRQSFPINEPLNSRTNAKCHSSWFWLERSLAKHFYGEGGGSTTTRDLFMLWLRRKSSISIVKRKTFSPHQPFLNGIKFNCDKIVENCRNGFSIIFPYPTAERCSRLESERRWGLTLGLQILIEINSMTKFIVFVLRYN